MKNPLEKKPWAKPEVIVIDREDDRANLISANTIDDESAYLASGDGHSSKMATE